MEDSLEKITINIDSYNATFIDDYEFYVDIIDDIKNCIYIKTLKTEVITDHYKNNSMFRPFEYIYISLNDIHRINTVSKEIVPKKFKDLIDNESGYGFDGTSNYIRYTKNGGEYKYDGGRVDEAVIRNSNVYIEDPTSNIFNDKTNYEIKDIYKIKDIYYNTLRYFDNIYINYEANPPADGIKVYKQELTGTSCGPNDTNTKVLNPILPELRRFNIILWRVNELGKHVKVPIGTNEHVFRVIMSFTIYYKRKKITRV